MRNSPGSTSDPRGIPARAGHGPDASPRDTPIRATLPAAPPQALRALHSDHQTPLSHAPSLPSIASHPRVGSGNVSRPLLRVGPAIPPPSPTPAHGSHCPPIGRFATSAFGARLRRISVPPDLSGPLPGVHSPFHLSDSALSVQRVACPRASCDTGRAAAGRTGSFNSAK